MFQELSFLLKFTVETIKSVLQNTLNTIWQLTTIDWLISVDWLISLDWLISVDWSISVNWLCSLALYSVQEMLYPPGLVVSSGSSCILRVWLLTDRKPFFKILFKKKRKKKKRIYSKCAVLIILLSSFFVLSEQLQCFQRFGYVVPYSMGILWFYEIRNKEENSKLCTNAIRLLNKISFKRDKSTHSKSWKSWHLLQKPVGYNKKLGQESSQTAPVHWAIPHVIGNCINLCIYNISWCIKLFPGSTRWVSQKRTNVCLWAYVASNILYYCFK